MPDVKPVYCSGTRWAYTDVRSLRWADPEHTGINCEVEFVHLGKMPFTAHPGDDWGAGHGREIFARCVNGDFGVILEYQPPRG